MNEPDDWFMHSLVDCCWSRRRCGTSVSLQAGSLETGLALIMSAELFVDFAVLKALHFSAAKKHSYKSE